MKRNERERFAELFQHLVHADTEPDAESDAALRVLSHALLNYWGARQSDDPRQNAQNTAEMTHALPWLAAFLASTGPQTGQASSAYELLETAGQYTLSQAMIARRLDAFSADSSDSFAQTPHDAGPQPDARLATFCALAHTERRLDALIGLDAQALRDALLESTFLLAAAAERCEDSGAAKQGRHTSALVSRLTEAVEPWSAQGHALGASSSKAIWVLAGLYEPEQASASMASSMGAGALEIAPKSLRFERGLAENMARMGFISAVRAALAFAPASGQSTADARASFLREFSVFRADESLLQLASALMQTRGLCLDYLRGGAPLASLSPWIEYLRGGCAELAEARQCTLREAMSYAHYCLHLVNICDFAALDLPLVDQAALSEATREALSQVEDELKEFALLGQREGLSDAQADLGRFERSRWRREGDAPFLADRLSRLRGAWREGVQPGPIGAPPRLDPDVSAHSLAIIDNLFAQAGESELAGLARIASNTRLRGYQWLELLEPPEILKLLAICTSAARDLPGLDITQGFDVDLRELGRWATDPERGRLNRRILGMLLARREMGDILNGDAAGQAEQPGLGRGLVAHTRSGAGGVSPAQLFHLPHTQASFAAPLDKGEAPSGYLVLQFIADPELKALLDLMGTSSAEDPTFQDLLERRLQVMLQRHDAAGAASESMLDDSVCAPRESRDDEPASAQQPDPYSLSHSSSQSAAT